MHGSEGITLSEILVTFPSPVEAREDEEVAAPTAAMGHQSRSGCHISGQREASGQRAAVVVVVESVFRRTEFVHNKILQLSAAAAELHRSETGAQVKL